MPRAGAHALLTRPPLGSTPKGRSPFDLHVLGAPPAFVLSQDQTLSFIPFPNKHGPNPSDRSASTSRHRPSRDTAARYGKNTAAKLSPPSLRALSASHRQPARPRPRGLSSKTRRPKPTGPSSATRKAKGPRVLKGNDEFLSRRHPTARPAHRRTRARNKTPGAKPLVTFGCAKDQRPASGRRPRIPSCLSTNHVKQQTSARG